MFLSKGALENIWHAQQRALFSFTLRLFLTCPEGGSLPVVVVVGEAGEARHAAGVVVLEPLEEFAEFLPAFLLLLQPLTLLLGWDSDAGKKDKSVQRKKRKENMTTKTKQKKPRLSILFRVPERLHARCREPQGLFALRKVTVGGGGMKF